MEKPIIKLKSLNTIKMIPGEWEMYINGNYCQTILTKPGGIIDSLDKEEINNIINDWEIHEDIYYILNM